MKADSADEFFTARIHRLPLLRRSVALGAVGTGLRPRLHSGAARARCGRDSPAENRAKKNAKKNRKKMKKNFKKC